MLASDPPFRRFLIGICIAALSTMSSGFLVVYGVSVLGAPDEMAGWYTATLFISQTVASAALGWLGDRHGFASVGRAMALAVIGLSIVALLAPSATWLLLAFVLVGVVQSGSMLARLDRPDRVRAARAPAIVCGAGVRDLSGRARPWRRCWAGRSWRRWGTGGSSG